MTHQPQHLSREAFKQQRKADIVSAALTVFSEHGLETTTMVDVAKQAQVGVASVYRYFTTKFDLALEAANLLWLEKIDPMFYAVIDESYTQQNGLEKIRRLLNVSSQLTTQLPNALSFLEYFDNFIVNQHIESSRLLSYNESLSSAKDLFVDAVNQGKQDGSIRADLDEVAFYYTISHTLMSLAQKLILRGNIVDSDAEVGKLDQVTIVIDMAISYIKTPLR